MSHVQMNGRFIPHCLFTSFSPSCCSPLHMTGSEYNALQHHTTVFIRHNSTQSLRRKCKVFLPNDYGLMTVFSFSLLRMDELVHIAMLLHVHVLRYATLAFTISHIVCLFNDTNSQGTKETVGQTPCSSVVISFPYSLFVHYSVGRIIMKIWCMVHFRVKNGYHCLLNSEHFHLDGSIRPLSTLQNASAGSIVLWYINNHHIPTYSYRTTVLSNRYHKRFVRNSCALTQVAVIAALCCVARGQW